MNGQDAVLDEALKMLAEIEMLTDVKVSLFQERTFSSIYLASGSIGEEKREYIIKLSKSDFESDLHDMYDHLKKQNIRIIEPVFISKEKRYIISPRCRLNTLDRILRGGIGEEDAADKFKEIGKLIRKLDSGERGVFDVKAYRDALIPQIELSKVFSTAEKNELLSLLNERLGNMSGKDVYKGVIMDISFTNLDFCDDGQIRLFDIASARFGDVYQNLAQVFIDIKFGRFNRFRPGSQRLTEHFFSRVLEECRLGAIDYAQFVLYLVRCLVELSNMDHERMLSSSNILLKAAVVFNMAQYKRYLFRILKHPAVELETNYVVMAETYDKERYLDEPSAAVDAVRGRRLESLLDPDRSMRILDVGTGTGSGIVFFSKSVKKMVGLDATRAMLAKAREKITALEISNAALVNGDASRIPFKDNTFDAVISLNFIHLFYPPVNQRIFMKEMERVVRPGGVVIVQINNALEGLVIGLMRKYSAKEDIGYNWPWDAYRLAGDMKVETIAGIALPGAKKLYKINKGLTRMYLIMANIFPFKYLSFGIFVKFRKGRA